MIFPNGTAWLTGRLNGQRNTWRRLSKDGLLWIKPPRADTPSDWNFVSQFLRRSLICKIIVTAA
jgi:hypothetical protein